MQHVLEDPFYYLGNFERALDWVGARYCHLLDDAEQAFIARFPTLPRPSRALLVRMVMRKGSHFRSSKLRYDEIGCPRKAAAPLVAEGWVDEQPVLEIDTLFALMTKAELAAAFSLAPAVAAMPKAELLEHLRSAHEAPRPYAAWHPASTDCVYLNAVDPLCERLRLLFFGNAYQDWTEFVLADLGIYRYEQVDLSDNALGFRTRADVDHFLLLQDCRQRLAGGEPAAEVLAALPAALSDNPWLAARREKLLFSIGQQLEREDRLEEARALYAGCRHAGARLRFVRVLERLERHDEAWRLASAASAHPENESELQQVARMLPRLARKLGLARPALAGAPPFERIDLVLPGPDEAGVELAVAQRLREPQAPVFYVENALLSSLFGLLCWRAIFAPLPGAFFHPFHSGPADLHSPDFHARRAALFDACFAELDSDAYRRTILATYEEKSGIASPFVAWPLLDPGLLELALDCIPASHLRPIFERMLFDIGSNCAGLPDLIQFFQDERRYRMIEVKGPGDRLQDNQIRWLHRFAQHDIPVAVCYVRWEDA
ncbi:MAG TPA: VRR-NUC domain-containing protein [Noviherbaspirillum sp.]|nr:VRR-NUC domain-containing protein [Noviherbaspirillum sp.]